MTDLKRPRRRLALSSFLFLLVSAGTALAFNYNEHRDVSNEALRRAIDYVKSHCECDRDALAQLEILRNFSTLTPNQSRGGRTLPDITYGDVVSAMDYNTDPLDMFKRTGADVEAPTDPRDLLNLSRIDKGKFFDLLHASHHDRNHFQFNALLAFDTLHRAALGWAREYRLRPRGTKRQGDVPSSLYRAIIMSAFSDHFLEDFFAPGHVLTPRQFLHDAGAMALHDRFHRETFEFHIKHADELEPFAPPGSSVLGRIESDGAVRMGGDGHLADHEDQAEFLADVQARAIADVLEAAVCPGADDRNHFTEFGWRANSKTPKGTLSPEASMPYGSYVQETRPNWTPLRWTPIFNIRAGFQALFSKARSSGRGKFDVETIVAGNPGKGWREITGPDGKVSVDPAPQFGLGVVYSFIESREYHGEGAGLRGYFPVTSFDLQFSVGADYRWYSAANESAKRVAADARAEFGYGILFVSIGLGRDYHLIQGQGFRPGFSTSAAVSLCFPISAISKFIAKDRGVPSFSAKQPPPQTQSQQQKSRS